MTVTPFNGKHNSFMVIHSDNNYPDKNVISQLIRMVNVEIYKDSNVVIMPDFHAGKGSVIGTTMTISNAITPYFVGVDIGCGVFARKLDLKYINYERLDKFINQNIPSGMNRHKTQNLIDVRKQDKRLEIVKPILEDLVFNDSRFADPSIIATQLGTLGGGNHYIEINKDDEDNYYLSIHSGSRNFGLQVAEHYQSIAEKNCNPKEKMDEEKLKLIEFLKSQNRESEIDEKLKDFKNKFCIVPRDLSYLDKNEHPDDFNNYINDLKICQEFARLNRQEIANQICKGMGFGFDSDEDIDTIHNYLDTDVMILRKGAVSAKLDEKLVIPLNMRDGLLICTGLGSEFWNNSAPHGAGRVYSRTQAKENISMEEFKESMSGIYSNSICSSTIDESPQAYKPMEDIIELIHDDTVYIEKHLRPTYNFKAKG